MSLLFRRQEFSPSCPSGGDWYACETGSKFVGCCNSSPCVNGCPDGNLAPASFDPAFYGKFNDQECPKGSRWYSCAYTNPPFLGCCKSVACGAETGCPVGDLTAGFLSSNPYIAEGYLSSANSSATSSASSTPAETSAAARPVVTSSSTKAPIGAIVGGVVGGLAVIAILVILLLWYRKRKASKPHQHISELDAPPEKPTPMYKDGVLSEPGTQDVPGTAYSSPAPTYSHSSPAPAYPSEMDGQSDLKPHPSPSASSSNPLGINTGSYNAYNSKNPPSELPPLAEPVVELDGTDSPKAPFGYAMSHRPANERNDSVELSSSNSVRPRDRPGQSTSPQPRAAFPSTASPGTPYERPPRAPSSGRLGGR